MKLPDIPPKRSYFCNILASARQINFPGWWEGSAYRCHPVGVICGGLLLANHWSTYKYCHASIATEPDEGWKPGLNAPASWGDPFPHPKNGKEIKVYRDGHWCFDDGPWRKDIWMILFNIEIAVMDHDLRAEWEAGLRRIEVNRKKVALLEEALASYRGAA